MRRPERSDRRRPWFRRREGLIAVMTVDEEEEDIDLLWELDSKVPG